jgi:RNA ligase
MMFDRGYTYLFEIIYPQNRIVVDYKGNEGLVLLGIVNTETGEEIPNSQPFLPVPKLYPHNTPRDELRALVPNDGSAEGLVVRFEGGQRVKVKTEEYVRLHRLLTGVSSTSIWDLLRNRTPLDEIIENVPDEFYEWVRATKETLEAQHAELMKEAYQARLSVGKMTRKEAAEILLKGSKIIASITFALLDDKVTQAEDAAWKYVKPEFSRPFTNDIDQ